MTFILIINAIGILISFFLVVLSLLNIFPKLVAIPLLFLFIVLSVHLINDRHRFRGFKSTRR
ncbi:hypothetical protein [Evansella tamaricis]|uniref:Uncharacterized protein n=1 Tax=Evansella tamaricis TaxID=2069301 RepID=A0ABS6JIR5_9BACI|nr:hypothetical protein [Evansella tamaricis]MBU9713280.1 hypothetical protein [Evansella tamaricis]